MHVSKCDYPLYLHMCTNARMCARTRRRVRARVHVSACSHACAYIQYGHMCCVHISTCIHVHICPNACRHSSVCMFSCPCTPIQISINAHPHTSAHARTIARTTACMQDRTIARSYARTRHTKFLRGLEVLAVGIGAADAPKDRSRALLLGHRQAEHVY